MSIEALSDQQKFELLEIVRQVEESPAAVACYAAVVTAKTALASAQAALETVILQGTRARLYPSNTEERTS